MGTGKSLHVDGICVLFGAFAQLLADWLILYLRVFCNLVVSAKSQLVYNKFLSRICGNDEQQPHSHQLPRGGESDSGCIIIIRTFFVTRALPEYCI